MTTPLNSTGNPPVDLDTMVPLALAIVMKAPFLANETLYQVAGLLLAGPISDNTTIDGFVKLVEGFLPPDNKISNLRAMASAVFRNVPHLRSYVVAAVNAMPSGEDQRGFMRTAAWVPFTITGIVLVLRLWSRALLMKRLLLCDWMILLSYALLAGFSAICQFGTQIGVGTHVWDVIYPNIVTAAKLAFVGELLYRPSILAAKLSLLLFYPTLCRDRSFLIAVYVVTVIQLIHFVGGQFAIIFQCYPVDFWHHLSELRCTNRYISYMILGASNSLLDAAIFALPLYIVFKLQTTAKEKIMSTVLFCMGSIVVIFSALRMQSLRGLTEGLDFTWVEARAAIYGGLEVNLAIICASIPSIRALVMYFMSPKVERRSSGSNSCRRPSTAGSGAAGSLDSDTEKGQRKTPRAWRPRWGYSRRVELSAESLEACPVPQLAAYPDTGVVTTCEAVHVSPTKTKKQSLSSTTASQVTEFCMEYEKSVEQMA